MEKERKLLQAHHILLVLTTRNVSIKDPSWREAICHSGSVVLSPVLNPSRSQSPAASFSHLPFSMSLPNYCTQMSTAGLSVWGKKKKICHITIGGNSLRGSVTNLPCLDAQEPRLTRFGSGRTQLTAVYAVLMKMYDQSDGNLFHFKSFVKDPPKSWNELFTASLLYF